MSTTSSSNKVSEGPLSSPESQPKNTESKVDMKEINQAKRGADAYREAVGFDESTETTGRVSEVISDAGELKGDSAGGGQAKTKKSQPIDPAIIRAKLLENLPSEKTVRRQVEKEIMKEIAYLHKKAIKMIASPGELNYFEMANLMKKIRELKDILSKVLKASLETLKTLWLRFVHGVM